MDEENKKSLVLSQAFSSVWVYYESNVGPLSYQDSALTI